MKLNLACGDYFVTDEQWINVDWASKNKQILELNLLEKLPFEKDFFSAIYVSHYLEQIGRAHV